MTFVSAALWLQGTYLSSNGPLECRHRPTTSVPQTLVLTRNPRFSPNSVTNTATITAADQFDPEHIQQQRQRRRDAGAGRSRSAGKTVSNAHPNVGDTITYTVTLTDSGPNNATSVQVTDLLPAGVTLVMATPSQGTYAPGTGLWNVGTVNASGRHRCCW